MTIALFFTPTRVLSTQSVRLCLSLCKGKNKELN